MLDEIKTSLRISHDKLDFDIQRNIDACLSELGRVGIVKNVEAGTKDNLVIKACELYVKWQYNYEGKAEQYERAFNNLRDALSMTSSYNEGAE